MSLNLDSVRFIRATLLVLCVALVGVTAYELVRPYRLPATAPVEQNDPPATTDEATPTTAEGATDGAIPPLSAFSEIIERPLFITNRKPFVQPASTPKRSAPKPDTPEQVLLSAIVITDEQRLALVYTDRDKKLQQLRQGEEFKGWTLTELRTSGIFLKKGQRTRYVQLAVAPSRRTSQEQREQPAGDPAGTEQVKTEQPG